MGMTPSETRPPEGGSWLDYVINRAGEGGVWSWEPDYARTELAALRTSLAASEARCEQLRGERDAALKLAADNEAAFDGKAEEFDQLAERLAERTAERDAAVRERDELKRRIREAE